MAVYDTDCWYLEESGSLQFVFVEKAAGPEKGLTVLSQQGHQVLGFLYIVQGHHRHLPGLAEGLGLGDTWVRDKEGKVLAADLRPGEFGLVEPPAEEETSSTP